MEDEFEKEIEALRESDKSKEKIKRDAGRTEDRKPAGDGKQLRDRAQIGQRSEGSYSEGDIKRMSEKAKKALSEALNKNTESTISISKEGNEWLASVEVLEEEYIPGMNMKSMSDIIGVYELKLSNKGELLSWNKKSSRRRGEFPR